MQLEDAFLRLDLDGVVAPAEWVRGAIAGGVDLVCVRGDDESPDARADLVTVCREEDALVVYADDADAAVAAGADGVHLTRADAPVGQMRTAVGIDALLGASADAPDDAQLLFELEADYVVWEGDAAAAGALRRMATAPLFMAVSSVEDARGCVENGMLRLSVSASDNENDDVTEALAAYSRVLGRCI